MSEGRRGLLIALVVAAGHCVLFAVLDQRPPNDHDPFYTDGSIPTVLALRDAPLTAWPGLMVDHFLGGELHPRLAQTALVATLAVFGESVTWFRLANLPFLLLLVGGTWLVARELAVRHAGWAAFVVATMPLAVHASRKWDLQFHAAALTPLGLWLGIRALRSPKLAPWVLFGAWQGLRLYVHPITAPDVALQLALFGLLSARQVQARGLPAISSPLAAVGAGASVGCVALGLVGEAGWALPRYLAQRAEYSEGWWWASATAAAKAGLAVEVLAEVSWLHLMPPLAVVLVWGAVLALWLALRPGSLPDDDRHHAWLVVGLLALALAQTPAVFLAVSNQAFLGDWLFVVPGVVVAAAWGLERALAGRGWLLRGIAALLVGQALFVVAVPPVLAFVGPGLLSESSWFDRGPLKLLVRSSSGRHYVTHFIPLRETTAGDDFAAAVVAAGADTYERYELAWDPAYRALPGCRLGNPADPAGWSWEVPSTATGSANRPLTGWPHVFAGDAPPTEHRPDALRQPPAPDGLKLVRVWLQPVDRWTADPTCFPRSRLRPTFLTAARARIEERFGPVALEALPDPTGQLVGRVVEWDRGREYAGVSYVLTGSALQLDPELEDEEGAGVPAEPGLEEPGQGTEGVEREGGAPADG